MSEINKNIVDLYTHIFKTRSSSDELRDCYAHIPEFDLAIQNILDTSDLSDKQLNLNFITRRIKNLIDTYPNVWTRDRKDEMSAVLAKNVSRDNRLKVSGVIFTLHQDLNEPFFKTLYTKYGQFLYSNAESTGLAHLAKNISNVLLNPDQDVKENLINALIICLNHSNFSDSISKLGSKNLSLQINNLFYQKQNNLWQSLNAHGQANYIYMTTLAYDTLVNNDDLDIGKWVNLDSLTCALYNDYINHKKSSDDYLDETLSNFLSAEVLGYLKTYTKLSDSVVVSPYNIKELLKEAKMPRQEALGLPELN